MKKQLNETTNPFSYRTNKQAKFYNGNKNEISESKVYHKPSLTPVKV